MPQAIIDTNVLVRAKITKNGSDYIIYKNFLDNRFELLYSDVMLQELVQVLHYPRLFEKYSFTDADVSLFVESVVAKGRFVYAPEKVKMCRDKDDDELLSIAKAVFVKKPIYIVTADEDLHVLKSSINFAKIVTAEEFLKLLN